MATSYANPGGTGDRTASITVTGTGIVGTLSHFVDGSLGLGEWFNDATLIRFDFGTAKVIDEAKFYQNDPSTQGSWQWQGGPDGAAWTNLGAPFTLGGATVQTITALAGNTTGYRFYQLVRVSGATSSLPWVHEFEFKIDVPAAASTPRVTHAPIELLSQPLLPPARVTAAVVEILGATVAIPAPGRVTQSVVELLSEGIPPPAPGRVTQALVEMLSAIPPSPLRVTHLGVEILRTGVPGAARTTQLAVEVFHPILVPLRLTQQAVELFLTQSATLQLTHEAVEVFLIAPPCTHGEMPIDSDDFVTDVTPAVVARGVTPPTRKPPCRPCGGRQRRRS